jgi:hypothetical protein
MGTLRKDYDESFERTTANDTVLQVA